MQYFELMIDGLVFFFELIGVMIITWAGFLAIVNFIRYEFFFNPEQREQSHENLRVKFGQKILISLEFFVASDLIKLIISPTYDALGKLAAFVAIRTVLSYFLTHEIREIKGKHWEAAAVIQKKAE